MHISRLTLSAALAGTLAACATGTQVSNRSVDSVHQPVVSNQAYVFDVVAYNGEISPVEEAKLNGWFQAINLGYGDRVAVDTGANYDSGAVEAVARLVGRRGLLLSNMVPVTTGSVPENMVRVVVSRSVASVPGCPNWDGKWAADFESGTGSNYGCAVNANLAAMVADPQDLVKGQSGAVSDPATASKAITLYRNSPPTGERGLSETETTGEQ